jgi:thiol-disulfide isomerase/thioredoxin
MSTRAPETSFLSPGRGRVTTSDLANASAGLPLLLAFFKVTCPTCKLAWPYLQRLHEAYGGSAIRIAGVAQDDEEAARAFYAEFGGATFELLLDPKPYAASKAFRVESVPHVVLVPPDGSYELLFSGWSRQDFEDLGARLAESQRLPPAVLVAPGDPVPAFRPG